MIIVTGGAGFIGSNIVAALEARGAARVVVCDRLRDGVKWRNVAKRELADIVHPDDLDDFLKVHAGEVSAIFHMGAISSTTETDADKIIDNNFKLSLRLWTWCAAHRVRFIYASSAATYGDGGEGFVDDFAIDFLAKLRPMNPYGWSKNLFDRRVARMQAAGDACPPQWVGLKFFNVYGPNEYHKGTMQSVVSHVYPRAKAGETASLFKSHHPDYEDGGQLRDFIYVKDCIDVMMWLLDNPHVNGVFNCGTGKARSFKDLACAVYRALGKEPMIEYVPTPEHIRDKYQYYTQADMTRLRAAGYDRAFHTLEDGVRTYVTGFLDREDPFL
ncbi:ADP-glyceromanno-heptose 6-epimerase [Varunaivibrio sulfuroxidans]|uniref:ADP-L-glycero-D-manno-heptose-6-epimerase n=1 Tax=Varunaivibrio sulfuroxidans TaxID=1773489 RepID=A0A4R3J6A6_9PROT|nr:ADP-glyceromanno-heptose 6-epimerase [Varunaivibrio sulfuroxidans]TCS60897.1 ADP-glyceromanno-heptose 6-epimerase precursor [Varunaivibrio sulfuroxidans]WES31694.1 ADP-glyceromanno-heptose 6-epimerase [Varunaivibrio sulfuroxidans]